MSNYRDLIAWREAMSLVELVYRDTEKLPKDEAFGLRMQIRRAAVSVPSNLAEGTGRKFHGEFRQFVGIASDPLQSWRRNSNSLFDLDSWKPQPPCVRSIV